MGKWNEAMSPVGHGKNKPTRAFETQKKPVVDGRRLRSEESRSAIVRAMLKLIEAGDVAPSAEKVAALASVGVRTVFRHFENMESLYREIDALIRGEIAPLAKQPLTSTTWIARLNELIDRRARIFERIMPFKEASDVHRHQSSFLHEQMDDLTLQQRSSLFAILPAEMRMKPDLRESLDLALSFEAWRRLRKEQRLSVVRSRRVMHAMASALIRNA